MTQAVVPAGEVAINEPQEKEHLLTFQEYLDYEGEPDFLYELVRGKLIAMSAPTLEDIQICEFLRYKLQCYVAAQNLFLVVKTTVGVRTEENSYRIPDAIVCNQSLWEQIRARPGAGVLDFDEKPILAVEIVSSDRREDYVIKRNEYETAEIAEYWIVDPKKKRVRVFVNHSEEGYSWDDFTEDTSIIFGQLEQLFLSVKELLAPPLVEELIREEQAQIKTMKERVAEGKGADKLAQQLREMGVNPDDID
ncbi:MAG: Uma2 family endonuclease [Hormoscilla sp. SP12CHS1]|nr:Uma2 family endonuclease [Hormoscilla sp. SP12CHS1]